jgi:anti-sigma B factor antagonist
MADGVHALSVEGGIDVHTASELKDALDHLLDRNQRVAVDLNRVATMDSTGVAALFEALRRARAEQRYMALLCDNPQILKVLHISGLSRKLNVFRDQSELEEDARSTAAGGPRS